MTAHESSDGSRDATLRRPTTAVLATTWTHGRLHAVPVWFLYEHDEEGDERGGAGVFKILTDRGSQKHRNALRSGRASLCIPEAGSAARYLTAEGRVEVVDPLSYEQRLALHIHYRGEAAAHRIVDQGGHERMVMLVLHPEHWLSGS